MVDDAGRLPLVLIEATWQAKPMIKLLETTPALAGVVEFRHLEQPGALAAFLDAPDPELHRVVEVWQQVTDFWKPELWRRPSGLPADLRVTRFPFLDGSWFWPLAGSDPRNRSEAPLYPDGRYRYSDHVAASLADQAGDDDDSLYRRYLEASVAAFGDLEAGLVAGIAAMAARDALCDVRFTLPFVHGYRQARFFHAPHAPTGIAYSCLGGGFAERIAHLTGRDPGLLRDAVERQAAGLQGVAQFQHPVHPEVARRLGLDWTTSDGVIRFGKNRWTHRTAMVRAIRWQPWTP